MFAPIDVTTDVLDKPFEFGDPKKRRFLVSFPENSRKSRTRRRDERCEKMRIDRAIQQRRRP